MVLSPGDMISSGAILLAVVAIAYGGTFLLRVYGGNPPTNDLQKAFFRAGHGHAGVLVILGLVIKILTSTDGVPALAQQLSDGVLGGFNRSSQHLDRGGADGATGGVDDDGDRAAGDALAGATARSAGE